MALHEVAVEYPTAGGPVTAVAGADLAVAHTGMTVLTGPSGSGKSTLLRVLGLVERPTRGTVELDGTVVSGLPHRALRRLRRHRVALVAQNPVENLLPQLTVRDNLRAAAQSAHRPAPEPSLLDRLGLAGTAGWRITALSGGQQQRLALGCALVRGAGVVLADEPTSQLDAKSAGLVVDALADLAGAMTVVVASHDPRLVAAADRVVRLHDGRLREGS
ncbi:ABC transporter ATP-binding protein [Gandjariella thermophila]|nr:ATP-binding cassette domain-containing protein [Gandjariella thermophila]